MRDIKGRLYMVYVIICVIIGFLIGLSDCGTFFDGIDIAFFGAVIGSLIWLSVGGIVGLFLPIKEDVTEQKIYALNDSSSIEGSNFLFLGNVDEKLQYRYVIKTDKGKCIKEVAASEAYITEKEGQPVVRKHTAALRKKWYYSFASDVLVIAFKYKSYTEFVVPPDTVTDEYNVDLQ